MGDAKRAPRGEGRAGEQAKQKQTHNSTRKNAPRQFEGGFNSRTTAAPFSAFAHIQRQGRGKRNKCPSVKRHPAFTNITAASDGAQTGNAAECSCSSAS